MTYDDEVSPREKKISRNLAIGMHVVALLLLVFGVAWQRRASEPAAVVDLWSSLQPPKQEPAPAPKPVPKVERKPEAKPEPRPEPKPVPKPEAKPVPKPDIALKDKLEKEKKLKEQELEKKKEEEKKKLKAQEQLEAKKKEEEKRKLEKERVAQDTEAKRLAAEKQMIADRLAKEQAASQSRLFDEYVRKIQDKIRRNIIEPPGLQGSPQVEFQVRLLPGGDIMDGSVRMTRSSGNAAYDRAVEAAIIKSSPLPLPPDASQFSMFRDLNLKIRPRE